MAIKHEVGTLVGDSDHVVSVHLNIRAVVNPRPRTVDAKGCDVMRYWIIL